MSTSRQENIIKDFGHLTPDILKAATEKELPQEQDPKARLDALVKEAVDLRYTASVFEKRHEDAKMALTKGFALFVLVTEYPELFPDLVSILMARGRKRKPSIKTLALVALQVVTNARDEDASKLCSKQAPILRYAANESVTVESFPAWLETVTAKKARAETKGPPQSDNGGDAKNIALLEKLAVKTGYILMACPTDDFRSKLQSFEPGPRMLVIEIGEQKKNGFVPVKGILFPASNDEPIDFKR